MDFFSNFLWLCLTGELDIRNFQGWAVMARETYVKDTANNLLAQITPNLMTAAGYAEKAITGYTVTHNQEQESIDIALSIPSFGNAAIGQVGSAVIVYHKGTVNGQVNPLAFVMEGSNRPTTGGAYTATIPDPAARIHATRASTSPLGLSIPALPVE